MWFIAVIVVFSSLLKQASPTNDLDTLYNRILSDDPQYGYLKQGESFEYLKEVRSLEPEDISPRSNDDNKIKCDRTNIDILVKQLLHSEWEDGHIKRQEWSQRVSECKPIWRTNLKSEILTLNCEEKWLIQSVAEELTKATNHRAGLLVSHHVEPPELASALAPYLVPYFEAQTHFRIEQFLVDAKLKKVFQRECTRLLTSLCSSVRSKLGKSIELFDLFIHESEIIYREDDEYIRDWLNRIEVCKIVHSRGESISEELYKLLKEKYLSSNNGCCLPVMSAKIKQVKAALQGCLLKRV